MTVIVTDGNFLIADHRTTKIVKRPKDECGRDIGHLVNRKFTHDTALKISLPLNMFCDGHKIIAYAMSGSVDIIDIFRDFNNRTDKPIDFFNIFDVMNNFKLTEEAGDTGNTNGIVFYEDGRTARFYITVDYSSRIGGLTYTVDFRTINISKYVANVYTIGDTGGWNHLSKFVPSNVKLEAIDVFQYCAHISEYSTTSYSVYSRKHNMLYANVQPTAKETKERFKRVQNSFKFF